MPKGGGYFHIRRSGGLGADIKFRGKIWGKVQPSSPNKRKKLGKVGKNPSFGPWGSLQFRLYGGVRPYYQKIDPSAD